MKIAQRKQISSRPDVWFSSNHTAILFLSLGEPSILEGDNINDELDLRLESVLQSTGHHYEGELWDDLPKRDQIKGVFGIAYLNCLLGSDI
ncbi:hypothetical protein Tco_0645496 [Tanacetum coccineum]